MSDCDICFCTIIGECFTCCDPECLSKVCKDCLKSYISLTEKGLIKCVIPGCEAEFLLSEILKCKKRDIVEHYIQLCFNFLKNDHLDDIVKEINQKILIEKIRKEKHDFIIKEYPKAISHIINTCLKTKVNAIIKKNRAHIKESLQKFTKKCPNIVCYAGVLDISYTCLICVQKFCKHCEGHIIDMDHICKIEDIASVNVVEKLIKCPECKLPVIKSWGCNNITCSNCKTNFHYVTGNKIKAGNHSDDTITLKKFEKLSGILEKERYKDIRLITLIKQIEDKQLEIYPFEKVLRLLKKYIISEKENIKNLDDQRRIICLKYQKYRTYQYRNKIYFKCMSKIYESYINKTLDRDMLFGIYKFLH